MSDDLEGMAYGGGRGERTQAPPPSRVAPPVSLAGLKISKAKVIILGSVVLLTALLLLLPPSARLPSPAHEGLSASDGRLLSDVRGDDVLHRLATTQAALKREMALLRQWASRGGEVLPSEADTARALASLEASQAHLGALVGHVERGQVRLRGLVEGCQTQLAEQRQRLDQQEQMLQEHLAGERN